MEIIYNGTDITGYVQVKKCVCRDTSVDRCDSLDIEFENAAGWYRWQPEEDDQIIVSHNGYNTGIMYVNTILPVDGRFRIFATSLPCAARTRGYRSFTGNTIEEIMRICAISSGMDFKIYGLDGRITIPYIQRENEGCAAFLYRLLKLEKAALKCVNGKYVAIGYDYAQAMEPHQTLELAADQPGTEYKRNGLTLRSLTVAAPYATASATDTSVPTSHSSSIRSELPVRNSAQAGRWARGLLFWENRQCESLEIQSEFNIGYTAMTRIDALGSTDVAGEWLIDEAAHDMINLRSKATLRRCISTIQ